MVTDALVSKSLPDPVLQLHRDVMLGHVPCYTRLRGIISWFLTPPSSIDVYYFLVDPPLVSRGGSD